MRFGADTVEWFVREMRKRDWVERHFHLGKMEVSKPAFYDAVVARMSPDEALAGTLTGAPKPPDDEPIVMRDRPWVRRVRRRRA